MCLFNMSVLEIYLLLTILAVFALLNGFVLNCVNWSSSNRQECLTCTTVTFSHRKKLLKFRDRGSIPTPHSWMPNALSIVLTCHFASYFSFDNVCQRICCHAFVKFLDNLISLFLFILRVMSVSFVALSCLIVCFQLISHLSDFVFIEHVSSRNLPVINSFICLCFVEWVCA